MVVEAEPPPYKYRSGLFIEDERLNEPPFIIREDPPEVFDSVA